MPSFPSASGIRMTVSLQPEAPERIPVTQPREDWFQPVAGPAQIVHPPVRADRWRAEIRDQAHGRGGGRVRRARVAGSRASIEAHHRGRRIGYAAMCRIGGAASVTSPRCCPGQPPPETGIPEQVGVYRYPASGNRPRRRRPGGPPDFHRSGNLSASGPLLDATLRLDRGARKGARSLSKVIEWFVELWIRHVWPEFPAPPTAGPFRRRHRSWRSPRATRKPCCRASSPVWTARRWRGRARRSTW